MTSKRGSLIIPDEDDEETDNLNLDNATVKNLLSGMEKIVEKEMQRIELGSLTDSLSFLCDFDEFGECMEALQGKIKDLEKNNNHLYKQILLHKDKLFEDKISHLLNQLLLVSLANKKKLKHDYKYYSLPIEPQTLCYAKTISKSKMYKFLALSILFCVHCTAAPAIENGDSDKVLSDPLPSSDTVLSDPVPSPVDASTEHEHGGDLESFFEKAASPEGEPQPPVMEAAEENIGERARRSPAEDEKKNEEETECVTKGKKGTCVKYYLCNDSEQEKADSAGVSDIPEKECASYLDTCCLKLQTNYSVLFDIQ
ncbi:hypothetical protein evm_006328 [Chilo suppressalis]|nr:hypothetical protein evm_006328 [Chilo suppressalis]